MFESGAFFEIADGELNDGVLAVELVSSDGVEGGVGDEGVVAPIGPQSPLGWRLISGVIGGLA